ncbi:hypothetical protein PISMIDRAFT_670917 [Pisolithus microcarpus 441]|uniref:C2H2-type domain-containing protein n=1 Tax=Pisolithus microcarpus 441 TaxID=765257 RepID=A0A0D0AF78_9AGAM|nr:hypothetical protein PISMIDRAFT_670917 [Pisolithus microcarpus 441]
MKRYRHSDSQNVSPNNTTTNYQPRNTHATPALQHSPTETPTLFLRHKTNLNTIQESIGARHPLSGLGISYTSDTASVQTDSRGQRGPCQQLDNPIQVNGKGVLGFTPVNISSQGMEPLPVDFPSTVGPTFSSSLSSIMDCAANLPTASTIPCSTKSKLDTPVDLIDDIKHISAFPIGLVADVNMHDFYMSVFPPSATVNPLDTFRSSPYSVWPNQTPLLPLHDVIRTAADQISESPTYDFPSSTAFSGIEHSITQSASEDGLISCNLSIPQEPDREPRQLLTRLPKWQVGYAYPDDAYTSSQPQVLGNREDHPSPEEEKVSSPIMNAHLGVDLRELKRKADIYRLNHPGENITRSWLSHFAGNLSRRGELLDDYRCYVIGCNQRNKRRDHILVHVGAHVDQRPFACSVCSHRFLRKNECKRHEASHSGYRPYSCDVCGRLFSRKDLVKKHLNRVHRILSDRYSEERMEKRIRLEDVD